MNISAEKDITEKKLEEYDDVFADIVNVLLFAGKRIIKENELSAATPHAIYKADGQIHSQERDVAKYWQRGKINIAFIGFENQTTIDKHMPIRVLSYDGATYRDQLNKDDEGKVNECYPVVTIVLYFGEQRWEKYRHLKDCFKCPPELAPFVNDYKINVFEIAWLTDEQVKSFTSDFKHVADFYTQMRKNKDYKPSPEQLKHVKELMELFEALGDRRFMDSYNEHVAKKRKEPTNMFEVLDKIEARGEARGKAIGESKAMKLINFLLSNGKSDEALEATEDKKMRDALYIKYNIA